MISMSRLEGMLDKIKMLSGCDVGLWDSAGSRLYSTDSFAGADGVPLNTFLTSNSRSKEVGGVHYAKVMDDSDLIYVLMVSGTDAALTSRLLVCQLEEMMASFKDNMDKEGYIRDLLLDNLLLVDITSGASKLKITHDLARCVFLAEGVKRCDIGTVAENLDVSREEFLCLVEDGLLAYIADVDTVTDRAALTEKAEELCGILEKKGRKVRVGYGSVADTLKDLSHSYKEAHMAIDVGKIFFEEDRILSYSNLGIGRLIYQLPVPLCRLFIKEMFDGVTPDDFDEETLTTIRKFFESSLNVSETSRQLFIHRNTLVYRLDKIQKLTGLDLRVFDDAITFKIAMLVVKYMKHVEEEAF